MNQPNPFIQVSTFSIYTTMAIGSGTAQTDNPICCTLEAINPGGSQDTNIPGPQTIMNIVPTMASGDVGAYAWSVEFTPSTPATSPSLTTYALNQLYQLTATSAEGSNSKQNSVMMQSRPSPKMHSGNA
jgi:hypothetical protein